MKKRLVLAGFFALVVPLGFLGCGDNGSNGAPGVSTGTVSGAVTNSVTSNAVAGATVTADPGALTAQTAADGTYSLTNVPAGVYTLTFAKAGFTSVTTSNVSVVATGTSTEDATLVPTSNVFVETSFTGSPLPGGSVTATATPTPLDGSTVTGVTWSQVRGAPVTIDNTSGETTSVTLPAMAAFKTELFQVINEPPITAAQLPSNVPVPPSPFPAGLQDRFGVQALNPFELEEAGTIVLQASVTTTSGTYTQTLDIPADVTLPWKQSTGIQNVPVNVPVLLHGGNGTGPWAWSLSGPASSTAAFDNASEQNPSFTPDVVGAYTVSESNSGNSFTVYVGTWAGAITGENSNGEPLAAECTFPSCHGTGATAPDGTRIDKFGEWMVSGHAMIFSQNVIAGGHYTESCFVCHTVGYDTDAVNNGVDDQSDYAAMLAKYFDDTAGFSAHGSPIAGANNYADILASFPDTARLTNIQCENCHGPNIGAPGTNPHVNGILDPERISINAEVCGSCHGEPARHGRYQQWQLSGHANFELAIEEGEDTNCARCHSGNGFIVWGQKYDFDGATTLAAGDITWDNTSVYPQVCAACHNPHNEGNLSGVPNNATVRVDGDTKLLVAGFTAIGVGRGAVCITCHNSRRGLRNDVYAASNTVSGQAPHPGTQGDILMGQNAYFVTTGAPSKHAYITDTCTACHMEKTPPPAALSYTLGGTNHTFFASPTICVDCHTSVTADEVQGATEAQLTDLQAKLNAAVENQIKAFLGNGDNVALNTGTDNVVIAPTDNVTVSGYTDSHGNQAATVTVNGTDYLLTIDSILVNGTAFSGQGPKTQTIVKAGWNFEMAESDSSKGIHNPSFVQNFLAASINQLDATDFTAL